MPIDKDAETKFLYCLILSLNECACLEIYVIKRVAWNILLYQDTDLIDSLTGTGVYPLHNGVE